MAFILKKPVNDSKGIAIFTHKEAFLLDLGAPFIGAELRRLRRKYVVGMHWGFRVEDVPVYPAVDFHLAKESTVQFRHPERIRALPFNSSMFTPSFFCQEPVPKHWDIICVTRTAKFKNTNQLLDCLRIVYDLRPQTRALVLCGAGNKPNPKSEDVGLWDQYVRLFDPEERERFKFVMNSGGMFPFAREDVAFFFKASRVFTLFTDTEGVAKVINEALLCGLPVVTKRDLKGGGEDYLDATNSRRFGNNEEGARAIIDLIEHPVSMDSTRLAAAVSETHTIPKFRAALEALFGDMGLPFEGEIDTVDLSRKLPSHRPGLIPGALKTAITSDLMTPSVMVRFLRMVNDEVPLEAVKFSPAEEQALRMWEAFLRGRKRLEMAKRRAKKMLAKVAG